MPRIKVRLAEWGPELRSQYSLRNPVPFDEVLAHAGKFLWVCAQGHEWDDLAAARRAMPAWKHGDPLACPQCAGLIVIHACGHTVRHNQLGYDPAVGCKACRAAARPPRGNLEALFDDRRPLVDERTRKLLADLPLLVGPLTLTRVAERHRAYLVREAVARDLDLRDAAAVAAATAAAARVTTSTLLPSAEQCAVIPVVPLEPWNLRRATTAWGPGLAHHLGRPAPIATSEPTLVAELAAHLAMFGATLSTSVISEAIWQWSLSRSGPDRAGWWRLYREVLIPVAEEGELWGRVDALVHRPDGPDLVIEIDRGNKTRSVTKLAYARDAGAVPIWIRWGQGSLDAAPDWLPVIDLRPSARRTA